MIKRHSRTIVVAAAVAWLFVVTATYYVIHKPFSADNALGISSTLLDVSTAVALIAAACGIGHRLTKDVAFNSPVEKLALVTGLGLGVLSFGTFALGVLGLLQRPLFWALLLFICVILRKDLATGWIDLRTLRLPIQSKFECVLAASILLSLVIGFLIALTPPVAWDAQTYHLVEANYAVSNGRIVSPPNIVYFSFPSLVEMLFLAAIVLKGDIVAQLIHFCYLLLVLGLIFGLAVRYFHTRTGWAAAALFVGVPSILAISTWAYVDIALTFYVFAALYATLAALDQAGQRWVLIAGVFSGMAMGVKYTAALVPMVLAALIISQLKHRRWHSFLLFVATSGLIALPWYIRNWIFTGNPVYPFLFGGPNWDGFRTDWFSQFGTGLLNRPLELLTVPWRATMEGQEGILGYQATIGPLFLGIIPLLLLSHLFARDNGFRSTQLRLMLIFAGVFSLYWLAGVALSSALMQTRLLFPVFPIFAIAAAVSVERLSVLDLPQLSLKRLTQMVMLLVLGLTGSSYLLSLAESGTVTFLTGIESRDQYLARNLGAYGKVINYINTDLPESSRILGLWEPRIYYVRRSMQPDPILDLWGHQLRQSRDPAEIAHDWLEAGYTHILLNRQGLDLLLDTHTTPTSVEDIQVLSETLAKYGHVLYGEPLEIVNSSIIKAREIPYAVYALERH